MTTPAMKNWNPGTPFAPDMVVGSYWKTEVGVYKLLACYPSIGGTTEPAYQFMSLREEHTFVYRLGDIQYHRFRNIAKEDVPMALLGAA